MGKPVTLHECGFVNAAAEVGVLPAGGSCDAIEDGNFEFCMMLSGAAADTSGDALVHHAPLSVTLNPPGTRPGFSAVQGDVRYVSLTVDDAISARARLEDVRPFFAEQDPSLSSILAKIAFEVCEGGAGSSLMLEGLAAELLGLVIRREAAADKAATAAAIQMRRSIQPKGSKRSSAGLTAKIYAGSCGLSETARTTDVVTATKMQSPLMPDAAAVIGG